MAFERPMTQGVLAWMALTSTVLTAASAGGTPAESDREESVAVNCEVDKKVKPLTEIAAGLKIDILDVMPDALADEQEEVIPPDCSKEPVF